MTNDPLREELRRLALRLQPLQIRLIVGGGYGLLLRTEHIRRTGARTRFREIPAARSTNDIDLFLGAAIITDADKTSQIRAALDDLGYVPVEAAKYYQFVLPIEYAGLPRGVKIDLLAAPVQDQEAAKVKVDSRRIRPRDGAGLHAHTTPEAITVEDHLLAIDIRPNDAAATGGGDNAEPLYVYLPHPFSCALLKLFALRDQLEDEEKGRGTYHAFDIYRTVALFTAGEWDEALAMRDRYADVEPMPEARKIVSELFSGMSAAGMLRVREHARATGQLIPAEQLGDFLQDIKELYGFLG